MHRQMVVATIATFAFGLGSAGCGGASGPLTAAELSRQATAICKQRNASIAALRTRYHRDVKAMAPAALPIEDKSIKELAKLPPPANARASYGRFVAIERTYLRILKAQVAGSSSPGGTTPDRTHEVWDITGRLGIEACQ